MKEYVTSGLLKLTTVVLKTKLREWEDENLFVEDIFDKRFIQIYEQPLQLNKENK